MPHNLRRRGLTAALVFGFIAAWAPASVFAHVEFEDAPATVAPNSDIDLTLHVPNEREATNFNVGVAVQLPEGWTGVTCEEKPTWTCEIATEDDHVVVHFDKDDGAAAAEDEVFEFTLHSSATLGVATFPTIQTYDTGEPPEVAWIGEPDSDEPAPSLEVAEAGATTTSAATATTTDAPETTAAATTLAPSDSTTPEATAAAPETTAVTAETTGDTVTILETTVTTAADSDDDDSNTGAIIAIVILVIVAAVAGTIIYLRRRKPPVPPTTGGAPTAGGPGVGV